MHTIRLDLYLYLRGGGRLTYAYNSHAEAGRKSGSNDHTYPETNDDYKGIRYPLLSIFPKELHVSCQLFRYNFIFPVNQC